MSEQLAQIVDVSEASTFSCQAHFTSNDLFVLSTLASPWPTPSIFLFLLGQKSQPVIPILLYFFSLSMLTISVSRFRLL